MNLDTVNKCNYLPHRSPHIADTQLSFYQTSSHLVITHTFNNIVFQNFLVFWNYVPHFITLSSGKNVVIVIKKHPLPASDRQKVSTTTSAL